MKIAIIGSGYVGTTLAGILALGGHEVIALEINSAKVESINSGKAPFYELGLNEIISAGVKSKNLIATSDYSLITGSEIIFSCVGTPDKPDGSSDLSYIFGSARAAAKYMAKDTIFVQKSTVPVGTGRRVKKLLPSGAYYVSNPEFLREGTSIEDTLLFDRIVAGGDDKPAVKKVLDLHKTIEKNSTKIAKAASMDVTDQLKTHHGDYVATELESAELIKVTANAFLALKISFANSIAKLCDETGADIIEVMDAIGSDKRIGRAFLNAGRGFGGGCFPKDVSGLISSGLEHGVDLQIMTAAMEVNYSMPGHILSKLEAKIGDFQGKNIAVLGLAFKAGTSDARRSPAVTIANILSKNGAKVIAYDPKANGEAKEGLRRNVAVAKSLAESLEQAEIVVVATDWPEFTLPAIQEYAHEAKIIVDGMNCLDKSTVQKAGYTYIGVGR